jgi:hypothetical protein
MKQRGLMVDGEPVKGLSSPAQSDDFLFADSARHAYLEHLRGTPESCLWDFMNWRGSNPSDERI